MSSLTHNRPRAQDGFPAASTRAGLIGGITFDWVISLLGMVFLGGLYLDGWAHNHDRVDQSFFTPWHAFFYSGFLLIALILIVTLWVNHRRGAAWNEALPVGYSLSMLGVLIFAAGGVGDMLWHETFGVEADFDALFSPTHLVLAFGLNLMITGPLRAAWARPGQRLTWQGAGPMLLSLTGLISGITFLLMASHPLVSTIAGTHQGYGNRIGQIAGTGSILLTTAVLMGLTLLTIRRWQLPAGSLVVVWGINTIAMFIINRQWGDSIWLAPAMFVAIIAIEVVRLRMEPLMERPNALRLFAALAPVLLMGSYFAALLLTEGIDWSVHMWTGVVVQAGIVGWLLSYLIIPPAMPGLEGEPNVNLDNTNHD